MKTVCIYNQKEANAIISAAIIKHWWLHNIIPNPDSIGELTLHPLFPMVTDHVPVAPIFKDTCNLWFVARQYGEPLPNLDDVDVVIMIGTSVFEDDKPSQEMIDLFKRNTETKTSFVWIENNPNIIAIFNKPIVDYFIKGAVNSDIELHILTWNYFLPGCVMDNTLKYVSQFIKNYKR